MTLLTTEEPVAAAAPPLNSDALFEIINGQYVELPPMSTKAVRIASQLGHFLEAFAEVRPSGQTAVDALFGLFGEKSRPMRRPDVAFVSYDRWPADRALPSTDPWPVVPDLTVEVVSPNDIIENLMDKIREYFQAGVQLVWVVFPEHHIVHVYDAFTSIRVLTRTDELDGGTVLPGFKLPLTKLFKEPTP